MKKETMLKLQVAYEVYVEEDVSTEYMLQYMQDFANVPQECVINYLIKKGIFK